MNRLFTVAVGIACLCFAGSVARAQDSCSLQTFTGTYVFYEKGSSTVIETTVEPYPTHWAAALAPFITAGQVTMGSDGIGEGHFWIRVGSLNGGLEPLPVEVTITEMNADCTGTFTAEFILAGQPETILERFILFDRGREFRAIPISGGPITLAWIMEGHRISRLGEPLTTCGPQTARGRYVWTFENLLQLPGSAPMLSDAQMLSIDVAMNGEYTGMIYEKAGPISVALSASGAITVNPDCTFETDLVVDGMAVPAPIRGVFFDQGRRAFGLNMNTAPVGAQFSFGQAVRIGQ